MAIKLDINSKSVLTGSRFSYSIVADGFMRVFSRDSQQTREMKRREKVRRDLVKSQFGIEPGGETSPMIERIGQLLKLD